MITRALLKPLNARLFKGKVILLLGARQTGKTSLLKSLAQGRDDVLWLNGDESDVRDRFIKPTSTGLRALVGKNKMLVLDEAQQIPGVGLALKLLHDNFPDIQVIATGSSAFEIMNKMNEPLTGRKYEYELFPLSTEELIKNTDQLTEKRLMEHRLIFGFYPEVVNKMGDEKEILKLLTDSYLYKDLLMLDGIKKPEKLISLLRALALQVGHEVSYNEIGNLIRLDSKTVETYIALLEKSFVVFKLSSFSRNQHNELKASKKIYFYDNGVRNALVNDFRPVTSRQDCDVLWENFLVAERKKVNSYHKNFASVYFWRTKDGSEIDYIEEKDGKILGWEFKWNPKAKRRIPASFLKSYPGSKIKIISPENYLSFVLPKQ